MAYAQPWDEATPLGSEAANTLETIIQNLKIAIRERLEQVIPDWGDDTVDPKRVLPSVAKVEKTSPQFVDPAGGNVVLTWDAEVFDPDQPASNPNGLFDAAVDNTIFTIIRDGYYVITAGLKVDYEDQRNWTVRIVKNAVTIIHQGSFGFSGGGNFGYMELSTLAELVVGDTIRIEANSTNAGANSDVDFGSEFWIHMVNNL